MASHLNLSTACKECFHTLSSAALPHCVAGDEDASKAPRKLSRDFGGRQILEVGGGRHGHPERGCNLQTAWAPLSY